MRRLATAATLLLLSCSSSQPYQVKPLPFSLEIKPDEERAINIVWQTYAEYADEDINSRVPPIIGWTPAVAFQCPVGWCFGQYIPKQHLALLAWGGTGGKFSRSSMAHELCHAWFGDTEHVFCRNDLPPIETANKRLAANGL